MQIRKWWLGNRVWLVYPRYKIRYVGTVHAVLMLDGLVWKSSRPGSTTPRSNDPLRIKTGTAPHDIIRMERGNGALSPDLSWVRGERAEGYEYTHQRSIVFIVWVGPGGTVLHVGARLK